MWRRVDLDRRLKEVGLHLEQGARPRQTTVDSEPLERPSEVRAGGPSQPRHLRGDAIDRSPHQVGPLGPE